jgi:hypothetical protein
MHIFRKFDALKKGFSQHETQDELSSIAIFNRKHVFWPKIDCDLSLNTHTPVNAMSQGLPLRPYKCHFAWQVGVVGGANEYDFHRIFNILQELKDFFRDCGEVCYADAHTRKEREGYEGLVHGPRA